MLQCFDFPRYVRLVLTVPEEQLREACARIRAFCLRHYNKGQCLPDRTAAVLDLDNYPSLQDSLLQQPQGFPELEGDFPKMQDMEVIDILDAERPGKACAQQL